MTCAAFYVADETGARVTEDLPFYDALDESMRRNDEPRPAAAYFYVSYPPQCPRCGAAVKEP